MKHIININSKEKVLPKPFTKQIKTVLNTNIENIIYFRFYYNNAYNKFYKKFLSEKVIILKNLKIVMLQANNTIKDNVNNNSEKVINYKIAIKKLDIYKQTFKDNDLIKELSEVLFIDKEKFYFNLIELYRKKGVTLKELSKQIKRDIQEYKKVKNRDIKYNLVYDLNLYRNKNILSSEIKRIIGAYFKVIKLSKIHIDKFEYTQATNKLRELNKECAIYKIKIDKKLIEETATAKAKRDILKDLNLRLLIEL